MKPHDQTIGWLFPDLASDASYTRTENPTEPARIGFRDLGTHNSIHFLSNSAEFPADVPRSHAELSGPSGY